ncbi:agmatinase [filamentous cyanobacterium CCP1]|nr:agmatinase [filamentous cyanobacterium CCP2]PSB64906.1 agmatinase [filamentous cyanobacterium CCP1]
MPHYQPVNALEFPRFTGVRTFARLPHIPTTDDVNIAVVGLPFDTGVTYKVGARFGPESVRSASAMLRPYNRELKVNVFETLSCVDYGDAPVVPGYIQDSYTAITQTVQPIAEAGVIPLGIGGDHSITLAELRALAAVHGPLALVHFDAHCDLWDGYFGHQYTHGTPFRRAVEEGLLLPERSIQLGMRGPVYDEGDAQLSEQFGFLALSTTELLTHPPIEVGAMVRERVGDAKAFLTFDVDFFDPAFAPGTGTPEVGGPTSFQGLAYLRACAGLNWVGADVVEVLPAHDHAQITAQLAAQVGYEFMSMVAWNRQKSQVAE